MSTLPTILLVEDELSLGMIVAENLETRGYKVVRVMNSNEALNMLDKHTIALAIVDVMLPGMNGFELTAVLRARSFQFPILFLTSKTMPQDVVTGFESGGNDYLKKPFAMEELVVRIKFLLGDNRLPVEKASAVMIGNYHFDSIRQTLTLRHTTTQLTAREAEVLWLLYQYQHTLLPKKILLKSIWGDDSFFNSRSLDVYITRLRKLLQDDQQVQIINVRGTGYKLVW